MNDFLLGTLAHADPDPDEEDEEPVSILSIDNPYPLGVPVRVMREMGKQLDAMFQATVPAPPEFFIDCRGMTGSDWSQTGVRVREWLEPQGVDPHVVTAMCHHILGQIIPLPSMPPLISMRVSWNLDDGWNVITRRVAPPRPDPADELLQLP